MGDWQLLQEYVKSNSEDAFTKLVEQHIDLVHSAALRQVCDQDLAEDVSQAVFLILAKKAKSIRQGSSLAGWLYNTARYTSANALKQRRRRMHYEKEAASASNKMQESESLWEGIAPHLDTAMTALSKKNRDVVLLRYFEDKPVSEVAATLAISEDAAKKRISSALEKLRKFLKRKGIVIPAAMLATLLPTKAIMAAPMGLATASATAALATSSAVTVVAASVGATGATTAGGTAGTISTPTILAKGALKMMMIAKIKTAAVITIAALAVGGAAAPVVVEAGGRDMPNDYNLTKEAVYVWQNNAARQIQDIGVSNEKQFTILNDPLVKKLIELNQYAQEELREQRSTIIASVIHGISIDSEEQGKFAAILGIFSKDYMEELIASGFYTPETNTIKLGLTSFPSQDVGGFYDLQGKEIPFALEEVTENRGYIYLHLGDIKFEDNPQFIVIDKNDYKDELFWKEGNLRYFYGGNYSENTLNYYYVILPRSAILVETWPKPILTDTINGRTTIVLRKNGGNDADGHIMISFLWPEKDGTTPQDLPPEYRGLRERRDVENSEQFKKRMINILSGKQYQDFSTPITTLLTFNSGIINKNPELITQCFDPAQGIHPANDIYKNKPYFVDKMEFLSSPPWPEEPEEGYLHPVYMSLPGTLLRIDTQTFRYSQGRWHRLGNVGNPQSTNIGVFSDYLSNTEQEIQEFEKEIKEEEAEVF